MLNTIASHRQVNPFQDNVLVRPDPLVKETVSAGGIILPGSKPRPVDGHWATVVAIGPGSSYRKCCPTCTRPHDVYDDDIRVGDRVLMDSATSGDALIYDGAEHRMLRKAEILAVDESCRETQQ
jgi:co-chaperonin GroES (HSP10)